MAPPLLPTLSVLRERYVTEGRPLPKGIEGALAADPRAGAKAILDAVLRRRRKNRVEGQRLRRILRYEQTLWRDGATHVAGVDEVGMSPLVGPVVAAAVILPEGYRARGVDDSKKLDRKARECLAEIIRRDAIAWAIGRAEPEEIDRINIYHAGLLAMRRAVEALSVTPAHLLIDARALDDVPIPQTRIIHGDAESISIAAASIVAKVHRDALLVDLDREYPGYGFAKHKGYPVAQHYAALDRLGVTPFHRRSFGPVRRVLSGLTAREERS
ncbi:MAG: ribonuclease HII [Deltaproteobacteria bacterium]|nr:ribonuclease HII [Deltaproteobacteria bacterium]